MKHLTLITAANLLLLVSSRAEVTRSQVIEMAEAYVTFAWVPTQRNIAHKEDRAGIRVDTPDAAFRPANTRPGWWLPNHQNIGVPYMWGGFSSLEGFAQGISEGRFAGDIYTPAKRAKLDAAVSKEAVGIDCSGLVSRCWRLERSYSTRELPALCVALASYDQLEPGDILSSFNNHVLLFREFTDQRHTRFLGYEAGSPPTWKVLCNDIPVTMLKALGYRPYRYRKIESS